MKKEIIFLTGIVLIFIILFSYSNIESKKDVLVSEKEKVTFNSSISMMYESEAESGVYVESTENTWPTDGYIFNNALSKCENGGTLSWDDVNKKVLVSTNSSDKCYIYFDKPKEYYFLLSSVSEKGDNHGNLYLNNNLIDVEKLLNTKIKYFVGDELKYENTTLFTGGQGFYIYDGSNNEIFDLSEAGGTISYNLTGVETSVVSYTYGRPELSSS